MKYTSCNKIFYVLPEPPSGFGKVDGGGSPNSVHFFGGGDVSGFGEAGGGGAPLGGGGSPNSESFFGGEEDSGFGEAAGGGLPNRFGFVGGDASVFVEAGGRGLPNKEVSFEGGEVVPTDVSPDAWG